MTLTIITINRNNAAGLKKTLTSVASQSSSEFEHIIVDGASSDESVEFIKQYADNTGERVKWVSEPDRGIYNAMNKGIGMASGDYVQFLNSGDCLAGEDVTLRMIEILRQNDNPSILYGNMIKVFPDGRRILDRNFAGHEITFLGFYSGTLNHSPSYIRRDLFGLYGLYDESLKIVSDWKWFLQAIVLGKETPIYADIDVTVFDMTGISESNTGLVQDEREHVLAELIPATVLKDYNLWSFSINQMKRLKRHPWAYKIVSFIERCLFKIEKKRTRRIGIQQWQ